MAKQTAPDNNGQCDETMREYSPAQELINNTAYIVMILLGSVILIASYGGSGGAGSPLLHIWRTASQVLSGSWSLSAHTAGISTRDRVPADTGTSRQGSATKKRSNASTTNSRSISPLSFRSGSSRSLPALSL